MIVDSGPTMADIAKTKRLIWDWKDIPNPARKWWTPWRAKTIKVRVGPVAFENLQEGLCRIYSRPNPFFEELSSVAGQQTQSRSDG